MTAAITPQQQQEQWTREAAISASLSSHWPPPSILSSSG
jgi:hypothetical protein